MLTRDAVDGAERTPRPVQRLEQYFLRTAVTDHAGDTPPSSRSWLRGVKRSPGADHVVLISEWDTF